jgi:hypothetical protein
VGRDGAKEAVRRCPGAGEISLGGITAVSGNFMQLDGFAEAARHSVRLCPQSGHDGTAYYITSRRFWEVHKIGIDVGTHKGLIRTPPAGFGTGARDNASLRSKSSGQGVGDELVTAPTY